MTSTKQCVSISLRDGLPHVCDIRQTGDPLHFFELFRLPFLNKCLLELERHVEVVLDAPLSSSCDDDDVFYSG